MTTIRQLITSSPVKANELFARLVDTSDTAIKTRDRLFSELKVELDLQAELEEQHLFPVLKKHKETKALVADALNDNRETRKLLAELEGIPKDSEAFGVKVAELKKVFQRHVRDDKKEFLPAIIKALSDEEANAVVDKIEDEKARTEAGQRAEAEARRDEAKREREQDEAAKSAREKAKADAERVRKDADDAQPKARDGDDAADQGDAHPRADKRRAMVEAEDRAADIVNAGAKVARRASAADSDADVDMNKAIRASASATHAFAGKAAPSDADTTSGGQVMATLFSAQAQHALQTALAIGRAQTLAEVSEAQTAFIGGSMRRMGEFNAQYLALVTGGMGSAFFPSPRR